MSSSKFDPDSWFRVHGKERVHDGFMKFETYTLSQRQFDGGYTPELRREVMVAREAVAVLLYDPIRDEVIMVEQIRLPAVLAGLPAISREMVAGLIEPGEEPVAVARREVLEESGLAIIGEPVPIVNMLVSPGNTTQLVRLFCARIDARSAGGHHGLAEENEDIRVVVLGYDAFAAEIRRGRPDNAIALVAGYWFIENRPELRRRWLSDDDGGKAIS